MLRFVLLALLEAGQPSHGYALMRAYVDRSGARLSIGNVYRELQRLLADGLIVQVANPDGADPRRTPYQITQRGREALSAWLASPVTTVDRGLDEISSRLALLPDMDPERATAFLDDLRTELWILAKAVERERTLASRNEQLGSTSFPTRSAILTRRAMQLGTDIDFIEGVRRQFADWRMRQGEAVARLGSTTRSGDVADLPVAPPADRGRRQL